MTFDLLLSIKATKAGASCSGRPENPVEALTSLSAEDTLVFGHVAQTDDLLELELSQTDRWV